MASASRATARMSSADALFAMRSSKSTRASAAFAGSSEGNGLSVTAIRKRAMNPPALSESSSQHLRVHAIGRYPAGEEREDVVDDDARHLLAHLDGGAAEMRHEHDVRKLAQDGIDLGLMLEHVEAGTGDPACAQRPHQRSLVDDRPARGV